MIAYEIGFLSLIKYLQDPHPRITQPWYADDAGGGGIRAHTVTLPGPSGEGATKGLLPGSNQDYLGRGPA